MMLLAPPAQVALFTTSSCQFCRRAKEALGARGVAYQELDISSAPELRALLRELTGVRTVPQVQARGQRRVQYGQHHFMGRAEPLAAGC
jgi:glutaredoxin